MPGLIGQPMVMVGPDHPVYSVLLANPERLVKV
jgi:hypothetical protein